MSFTALSLLYGRAASRDSPGPSAGSSLGQCLATSQRWSGREQAGNTEIAHSSSTTNNMTVTETLKDAVGLGQGGPNTRTFAVPEHHAQARMRQ